MLKVAKSNVKGSHQVVPAAQFNVGRAYYQGKIFEWSFVIITYKLFICRIWC